jgi:hypothetical protein
VLRQTKPQVTWTSSINGRIAAVLASFTVVAVLGVGILVLASQESSSEQATKAAGNLEIAGSSTDLDDELMETFEESSEVSKTSKEAKAGNAPSNQMPDFTGKSVSDVATFLRSIGVTQWRESKMGSTVKKGMVARTNPGPGDQVDSTFWNKTGNFIEIFISTGSNEKSRQKR